MIRRQRLAPSARRKTTDIEAALAALENVAAIVTSGRRLQGLAEALALGLTELSRLPCFSLEGGQLRHGPMEMLGPEIGVVLFRGKDQTAGLVTAMAISAVETGAPVVVFDASGEAPVAGTVTMPFCAGLRPGGDLRHAAGGPAADDRLCRCSRRQCRHAGSLHQDHPERMNAAACSDRQRQCRPDPRPGRTLAEGRERRSSSIMTNCASAEQAGNSALAWQALGVDFEIAANVGNDQFGRWLREAFGQPGRQVAGSPRRNDALRRHHPSGRRAHLLHDARAPAAFQPGRCLRRSRRQAALRRLCAVSAAPS